MALLSVFAAVSALRADPIADFYRNKTVHLVIGYGVGGGYDLYGRLAAAFLGRHIPGNPIVVPQNMPGAGSLKAAQYLSAAAPRDGTVMATVTQTLALDAAAAGIAAIDVARLAYVGRLTSAIDVGIALPKSGIKTFEDVRSRPVTVGSTGAASLAGILPVALNLYAGAKFKPIKGYQGAPDVMLAMERGEIESAAAIAIPYLVATRRNWIEKGEVNFLYQNAIKRHPLLATVATAAELGLDEDGRKALRVLAATAEIGRSILTTPDVPPGRLGALRDAFQAMLKDPDFLAASERQNLAIDGAGGEELDAIVRDTVQQTRDLARFSDLFKP
jgi:tripartite-type tricarboxylate transporter receptor subunit TctC